MNCLWCEAEQSRNIGWNNFLSLMQPSELCDSCVTNLTFLQDAPSRCAKCSRETAEETCFDCQRWEKRAQGDPLQLNYSVFQYNPFLQEVIAKWKYRGDYVLGELFRPYLRKAFFKKFGKKKKELTAVPIPLSEERLAERGFNQAEMLADFLPVQTKSAFIRIDSEKQSKKSRKERVTAKNPFSLTKKIKTPVLLVDDIYTTGTTLRHASELLIKQGCPQVYALTLIRG